MKILVTGSTGFIGSNLIKELMEHKHQITAVGVKTEQPIPENVKKGIEDYIENLNLLGSSF